MARTPLLLACLAMALGTTRCTRVASDSYFPLHTGADWTYELQTEIAVPPVDAFLRMSVDRAVTIDGKDVAVRRSASGAEYYLLSDATGIRRVATRVDLDEEAQRDEPPRMVLPQPAVLGAEWEVSTVPYLLMRNAEFPRELKHRHKTMMRYRIEAVAETVEVPAGTFTDCLRVKGVASFKLFKDPIQGFADQPIIATEWYCKGVGLVQFDREELVNSSFLTGGKIRYRLVDYHL